MRYLVVLFLFWCSFVVASEEKIGHCKHVAKLAEGTMIARQQDVPMYELVDRIDPDAIELILPLIRAAYDIDVMPDGHKEEMVNRFSNAVFKACLDN
ncbi:hypothetical protein MWU49_09090 [Alcanivorax sp. S6407]|uniref:hypothetical protein n=1 Tax=Alcanivorax sp. S6407 TaxID=2926424 RepID=UPI001FF449A7|nr:hypothetical protein [Alcanivorax sp. S6407]MCK0153857.1 hypothetical protein [Alcanivorax sp. S6407]